MYRTGAIITRSWLLTAPDYKLRIVGPKIEEVSFLVCTVYNTNRSSIQTAVKNRVKNMQAAAYHGMHYAYIT